MKNRSKTPHCLFAVAALATVPAAQAVEIAAGDWKFSLNGNVNVHYINSQCEDQPEAVAGGLTCAGVESGEDNISTVSNGLLPAAFVFGVSTQQNGWDISGHLGLYPGVSTNDGGSPNLQGQGAVLSNTGLGTTGLDVRQVYMTFGQADLGTFMLGRNFGLFGFDAIINDMTIPGVGVAGAAAGPTPANTTLGSIGFGYLYTDTLGQMNYTTPDLGGLKLTVGIFDSIEPLNAFTPTAQLTADDPLTPANEATFAAVPQGGDSTPGFHGKAAYTLGGLYLSASFLLQENNVASGAANKDAEFDTRAFDIGGKYAAGPFEVLAWYYDGKGVGTTALLLDATDGVGGERKSDGFLVQGTFKVRNTKFGINYGQSNLDLTAADGDEDTSSIVETNSKVTVGVYHSLTTNLTLLAEFSDVNAEAHNGNENSSSNVNVGAFLSF